MKHQDIISKMTLREKIEFCSGKDFWHLVGSEKFGLPSINVTDGPHGIRKKAEKKTSGADMLLGVPAVCFVPACAMAASWDPSLAETMGKALGEECLEEKVSVILGPGVNIKRSPLCGRNFEYYSEDPFLAGKLATSFINGIQSRGVGTSIKHFCANNQEARRLSVDSVVDERALREIYLPGFEAAVKDAQPWTVMDSYNKLNGTYTSENKWLLTDVLRNEWGFRGMVMTDWGAANNRVEGIKAGEDLEMPGSNGYNNEKIYNAVTCGELSEAAVDECVDRIIDLILKCKETTCEYKYDREAHHALARKIASQCIVLLKNEDNILPLKKGQKIALIGEMARTPRYQGAGSSLINPTQLDCSLDELKNAGADITFAQGYDTKTDIPDARLIAEAVNVAKDADVCVVYIGLTDSYESEGFDRTRLDLPTSHNVLVNAVSGVNKNTVVVLSGGSPVLMPWLDKVKGLVNGYILGQAGGGALADVLLGNVNPSGKLPESYPLALEDCSATKNFPGHRKTVEYRESVFVGYRYYDTVKKDVLFPFGYGLSYTSFKYSNLKLGKKKFKDTDKITVSFKIKNTGDVAGAETAQVYVRDVESTIFRPEKELKGFAKIYLEPGEEKTVEIPLTKRSFAFYNVLAHDWTVESGDFEILVGAGSRDIRLHTVINVASTDDAEIPDYRQTAPGYYCGEQADICDSDFEAVLGRPIPPTDRDPSLPLTLENNLEDADKTRNGAAVDNFIKKVLDLVGKFNIGGTGTMLTQMALEMPMRNFVTMSGGVFSEEAANGLLQILNDGSIPAGVGKIAKGLAGGIKNIGELINMI